MRLTIMIASLGVGSLAFTQGCGSSPPSAGLWSCFDTGTQTACTQVSALSTANQDINGDGVPDHFVCADDDNDGHDRTDQKVAAHRRFARVWPLRPQGEPSGATSQPAGCYPTSATASSPSCA